MKNRDRREAQGRGQIEIHKPVMNTFVKAYPRFKWATDDYRFREEGKPLYLPVRGTRSSWTDREAGPSVRVVLLSSQYQRHTDR